MKLVCHTCGVPMKVEYVGVALIEMFEYPPRPYQVYRADRHVCPHCGTAVTHTDAQPELAYYQDGFADRIRSILNVGLYTVAYQCLADIVEPLRDEWKKQYV